MSASSVPQDRGPSQPNRRAGGRARALGIGLSFVGFVLAFIWLREQPFEDSSHERDSTVVPSQNPERSTRIAPVERNARLLESVRDESLADRLVREPLPYQHLLVLARTLPDAEFEAGDVLAHAEVEPLRSLLDSPVSFRGRAFIVRGRLLALAERDGSGRDETRGTLVTDFGQRVAFSVVEPTELKIGDRVRLAGLFFKLYADEASPGDYDPRMIYLIGRAVERSFDTLVKDADLAAIPFQDCQDRTLPQLIEWPQEVVLRTLNFLRSLPPEARADGVAESVEWSDLRTDPDRHRGRLVRVVGTTSPALEWTRTLVPVDEKPPEGGTFAEGLLRLPNERWFRFIGLEGIPAEVAAASREIALEGIFLKNVAWRDRRGDVLCAPLLVAARFTAVTPSSGFVAPRFVSVVVGLGFLCATLFILGVFSDRRDADRFRTDYLRRKRRQLERQQAKAPSPAGDSKTEA